MHEQEPYNICHISNGRTTDSDHTDGWKNQLPQREGRGRLAVLPHEPPLLPSGFGFVLINTNQMEMENSHEIKGITENIIPFVTLFSLH